MFEGSTMTNEIQRERLPSSGWLIVIGVLLFVVGNKVGYSAGLEKALNCPPEAVSK